MSRCTWNPTDPSVYDAEGFVVGLTCAPPHASLLADGWVGGQNLIPLVAPSPDAFSADLLVYRRAGPTLPAALPDVPPFAFLFTWSLFTWSRTPKAVPVPRP